MIRDRIKRLVRVPANELQAHPNNWRKHSDAQLTAIRAALNEIGFAGVELARELPDGTLQLIDGHARASLCGDSAIPVLVLDLDENEADKLLATYDPIGAMAGANTDTLKFLTDEIETQLSEFDSLIAKIRTDHGITDEEPQTPLRDIPIKPLPNTTWVLLGIPTIRYGEIAATIDDLCKVPDMFVEMTCNHDDIEDQNA